MENTTPKTAEEILTIEQIAEDNFVIRKEMTAIGEMKFVDCNYWQLEQAFKQFGRQVALQVRAECAEKAKAGYSQNFGFPYVDKESILSINVEQFIK